MSGEKILAIGDSLNGPTGFANNLMGISWCLADEYDVHVLGLQSNSANKIKITIHGDTRDVIQHPNLPRGNGKWDFGARSLPHLLDQLRPDVLLTVNDIQMISHIPNILYQNEAKIKMMDLPSKKMVSEDALLMDLKRNIQMFKEKYPLNMKWICYAPHDGEPPMPQWNQIYSLADQKVAFCKYGQYIFKHYYGDNVPYIYHGVDTDLFKPLDKPEQLQDKFVIGNFNRNQPRKQPVRCLEAFAKFAKNKDDVLLHMQMDWNDQFGWPIEYFSNILGIKGKMIQPRQVGMPREEVVKTYNMWDLNVTPTGGEGFGMTETEGMACEVPNIATDYTSTRELTIEGKPSPRGTPVPYKELYWEKLDVAAVRRSSIDVDALADVFNEYYYNRELVEKHGKNGREWVKKNASYEVTEKKWKKLVKDVLNDKEVTSI
jgi:glycosyltransferase involved in cell wall biosynthesis